MTSAASPVIISSWNSFLCKYWMRMRKFSFCRRLQSSPVIPSQLFLHNILSFVNLVFFKHHLPSSSSLLTHSLLSPSSSWSTCLLSQNLSYGDNWTWNLWNQRVPETWSNPEKKETREEIQVKNKWRRKTSRAEQNDPASKARWRRRRWWWDEKRRQVEKEKVRDKNRKQMRDDRRSNKDRRKEKKSLFVWRKSCSLPLVSLVFFLKLLKTRG